MIVLHICVILCELKFSGNITVQDVIDKVFVSVLNK